MSKELEHKKGYKQTKLGWIPEEWEVLSVGETFDFLKTYSFSRNQLSNEVITEELTYNIHYGDIHSLFEFDILDITRTRYLPKILDTATIKVASDYLKTSDLIMADTSEDYEGLCNCVELSNVEPFKIVSGLHTFALRDKDSFYVLGFKPYVFKNKNVKKTLYRIATGISVLGVSKSNLSKVLVSLPPLPEQEKIAQILSTWDVAIDKTQQLIAQLQLRKKGLMQQLLKNEKWKEKQLNKFIEYTPRPKPKPKNNFLALGLRSHGKGVFHKENFDPNKIAMETLYEVKEDDLVVNITFAWEHAIAVANKRDEGGLVSHRFPTYTFKESISDSAFFKYYILQPRFKYLLGVISPGGAGRNRVMSKKDFLKLKIKVPLFQEQKAIAKVLTTADKEIQQYQQYLVALKTQKKGLMQQLLTGKTRVKLN